MDTFEVLLKCVIVELLFGAEMQFALDREIYIGGEMDNSQLTWRLGDNIDLIEAQFVLGDFCLNHFPDNPQLARSVQNADSIGGIRTALKPIINLIVTQHKELTDEFTTLVHEINQTAA